MNYIAAFAVSLVISFALGFAYGHHRGVASVTPKLDTALADLAKARSANEELSAAVARQSAAVAEAKKQADLRAAEAANAIEKARKAALETEKAAQRILASRPPAGSNVCDAASAAFDLELMQERGK